MDKKIWFITGVSSGLGKAIAETVIHSGDYVIGTFRKEIELSEFNKKYKNRAKGILLDISKIDSIETAVEEILLEHGQIDVLVNNAGVGFAGAVEEASMHEVRKVFEVNFFGTLKLTQAVLPNMRERKSGTIVQISSHSGIKAFAGFGIYNASKFALEGFSEALEQEVKPLGIKVFLIEPGPFRTNFAGRSLIQANKVISDYDQTAGNFRAKLQSVHTKQEGDPNKAAKFIVEHVNSENSTFRLPLGVVPLTTIDMKIKSLQSDLDANKETASKSVF